MTSANLEAGLEALRAFHDHKNKVEVRGTERQLREAFVALIGLCESMDLDAASVFGDAFAEYIADGKE